MMESGWGMLPWDWVLQVWLVGEGKWEGEEGGVLVVASSLSGAVEKGPWDTESKYCVLLFIGLE